MTEHQGMNGGKWVKRTLALSGLWIAIWCVPYYAGAEVARYDSGSADFALAMAIDANSGNVYITGWCTGVGRSDDYLTVAYDSNLKLLWAARYDGGGIDHARAMAIGPSGNVYVTGFSRGDYATVAYDPKGNQLWDARYNGPGNGEDKAVGLAISPFEDIYVTGESYGAGTDFATVAYDLNGNERWVARYDGPDHTLSRAAAIATDSAGKVYVTGSGVSSGLRYDYATVAYDSDGNELWTARYDGPGNYDDEARAIAVGPSGNIYVTGYSGASSGGDSETLHDYATIAYDTNGNELWAARYNRPGIREGDVARAMAVGPSGDVYVTGWSGGDYATVAYDPYGNELWVTRTTGITALDATAIAIGPAGKVVVTGYAMGDSTYNDYLTIAYRPNGLVLWEARYNGPTNKDDKATAMAVGRNGLYVTGCSAGRKTYADYLTIKYGGSPWMLQLWALCKIDGGGMTTEIRC